MQDWELQSKLKKTYWTRQSHNREDLSVFDVEDIVEELAAVKEARSWGRSIYSLKDRGGVSGLLGTPATAGKVEVLVARRKKK